MRVDRPGAGRGLRRGGRRQAGRRAWSCGWGARAGSARAGDPRTSACGEGRHDQGHQVRRTLGRHDQGPSGPGRGLGSHGRAARASRPAPIGGRHAARRGRPPGRPRAGPPPAVRWRPGRPPPAAAEQGSRPGPCAARSRR